MYLTERVFALVTYLWILFVMCILIATSGRKYLGRILSLYTVLLSIMSFFFLPASGADLFRLIPIMHIWANLSFSELLNAMANSATPMYILYMNLIGRTQIDGLLPAITCFLFYRNVFYIFKKSVIKYELNASDASLLLFFFMSTGVLIEVISGIRTMLGFSFIAVCVYSEMIENKSIIKNIIWYIVASLLHPAVFVLTIIRFGYILLEKNTNNYQRFVKVVFLIMASAILYYYGKEYLVASFEKGKSYISNESYSYFWEYLIGGIGLFFIINMEVITSRLIKIEGDTGEIRNLLGFCKYISVILIIFCIEYNTFHRFVIFLFILSIPLLANILKSSSYKRIVNINFRPIVFTVSSLLLIIASTRGNLCSLKFFIL